MFPRPIQAVVFDMDGLLIDSETAVRQAIVQSAAALNYQFPDELFLAMVGRSYPDSRKMVADHFREGFPHDDWEKGVRAYMAQAVVCLKAGVVELLDELDRRKLPRAIATSSRRMHVDRHLGEHGLAHRFDAVVSADDVSQFKPHPAPYLKAAELLGMDPTTCLALEDSHNGVRAAHAAGMMTVMVPDLLHPTEEMQSLCIHIAESLHHVEALLKAGPGSGEGDSE
jgi:HAD superfamily hydrolase (TIGR01509 family)